MPNWSGGGSSGVTLPLDLGPGLFQIDAHGVVYNSPDDDSSSGGLNAGTTAHYGLSYGNTTVFLGGRVSGDGLAIYGLGPLYQVALSPKPGGLVSIQDSQGDEIVTAEDLNPGIALSFYGATPVVQPTGVAVTAAGIHAALVALGLITA